MVWNPPQGIVEQRLTRKLEEGNQQTFTARELAQKATKSQKDPLSQEEDPH